MSGELYGMSMPRRWPAVPADAAPYQAVPVPKYPRDLETADTEPCAAAEDAGQTLVERLFPDLDQEDSKPSTYEHLTDSVLEAIAREDSTEDAMPEMQCPQCKEWLPDFDGFGALAHTKPAYADGCGYCSHPALADGVCEICGVRP